MMDANARTRKRGSADSKEIGAYGRDVQNDKGTFFLSFAEERKLVPVTTLATARPKVANPTRFKVPTRGRRGGFRLDYVRPVPRMLLSFFSRISHELAHILTISTSLCEVQSTPIFFNILLECGVQASITYQRANQTDALRPVNVHQSLARESEHLPVSVTCRVLGGFAHNRWKR